MAVNLHGELSAAQRVVLAVDTSDLGRARELAQVAHAAGASIIKEGLEIQSAPESSWEECSVVAGEENLDWVADLKGDDIPNTIKGLVHNVVNYDHPPVAITMHTHSGIDSMKAAQDEAGSKGILVLGVTELTSKSEEQLRESYGFVLAKLGLEEIPEGINLRALLVHMLARDAVRAGIGGLVASAKELRDPIKSDPELLDMFTMIPGTRSAGAETHDQKNVNTPQQAIEDGADLLVIGREVTESNDPPVAFTKVVGGIQTGLNARQKGNA